MSKSKILDEFYQNRFCNNHKHMAEHLVAKVDEDDNGEFVGYYAECLVCNHVEDIDFNPENICINCGHSFSTEFNQLVCVLDKDKHRAVGEYDSCNDFN